MDLLIHNSSIHYAYVHPFIQLSIFIHPWFVCLFTCSTRGLSWNGQIGCQHQSRSLRKLNTNDSRRELVLVEQMSYCNAFHHKHLHLVQNKAFENNKQTNKIKIISPLQLDSTATVLLGKGVVWSRNVQFRVEYPDMCLSLTTTRIGQCVSICCLICYEWIFTIVYGGVHGWQRRIQSIHSSIGLSSPSQMQSSFDKKQTKTCTNSAEL